MVIEDSEIFIPFRLYPFHQLKLTVAKFMAGGHSNTAAFDIRPPYP